MLLPSALPCDAFARPSPSYSPSILSPPLTPTFPPQTTTNIHATCVALQNLLASGTSSSLSTPPCASRLDAPSPRRLLQSPIDITSAATTSFAHPSSRGPRKRRRSSAHEPTDTRSRPSTPTNETLLPSTPKRRCLYPPSLPHGLERADFTALHQSPPPNPPSSRPVPPARKILKPMTLRPKLVPPSSSFLPRCNSTPPLLPPSPPSPCAKTIRSPRSPPSSTNTSNLDPLLIVLVLQKLHLRQRNGTGTPARRIDW